MLDLLQIMTIKTCIRYSKNVLAIVCMENARKRTCTQYKKKTIDLVTNLPDIELYRNGCKKKPLAWNIEEQRFPRLIPQINLRSCLPQRQMVEPAGSVFPTLAGSEFACFRMQSFPCPNWRGLEFNLEPSEGLL